jgi:DHA1 family tetracycline resistance protein-like MFS transporter
VVTGLLVKHGLAAPILAAAGLSLTSIFCTLFLLPGGRPPSAAPVPAATDDASALPGGKRLSVFQWSAYGQYLRRPVLLGLLTQFFFFALCFTTFTSGFALFAERTFHWQGHPFSPREIGFLFAYAGLLGILLQGGLINRLVQRYGEPKLVRAGFIAVVIGYGGLGFVHSVPLLVVVATISSFGTGILRPILSSLISQSVERHEQGVVLGLSQSLNAMASIVAPGIAGLLLSQHLLAEWAWVAAMAAAMGLLWCRWGSARVSPPAPIPLAAR